ncbi:hypothetical protein SLS62_009621 [Diatrype stigma]|uniref:Uncharacterized protein n=1 Tax=Diatrype stigma TaxID=117547 RepID=A0AAN9UCQ4_9PEZI
MSPPLPVPSKAAIHALRGLAFGTSCAIGVLLEDRRRRISTLRTAIHNAQRLKASRHYHGALEYGTLSLDADDAVLLYNGHNECGDHSSVTPSPWGRSSEDATQNPPEDAPFIPPPERNEGVYYTHAQQAEAPLQQEPIWPSEEPTIPPRKEPPLPQGEPPPTAPAPTTLVKPRLPLRGGTGGWGAKSIKPMNPRPPKKTDPASIARSITETLDSHDEERLERALAKFYTSPDTGYMLESLGDAWLEITARLSKACQLQRRWEDAARVVGRVLEGPKMAESWYFAHDPFPIIDFYLSLDSRECPGAFTRASQLFLATFTEKPLSNYLEVERVGKWLFERALTLGQFDKMHSIYWRVLVQIEGDPTFTAWAIELLSERHDYKNVVKYFLLNFTKLVPDELVFNNTVNHVVNAVEAMKGLKASQVFRAYARMKTLGDGSLRTGWVMQLLQAHWKRHEDFSRSKELFDEARSLGLLDRVAHPQGVYCVMVEIAIRADKVDVATAYYDELVVLFPDMASDVQLKGYFALAKAKAGDWEGVYRDFTEMHSNSHRQQDEYNEAFISVLKVFLIDHPVADVQDFITIYTRDLHVGMHRYIVTLVANKYGQCRDVSGFLDWLKYCSEAGFAPDPVFCNAVLHNCRTQWKFSFKELVDFVSAMRQVNPSITDDSTERILSQSARAAGMKIDNKRGRRVGVFVNKLAYVGRSMNNRDVYEAMNQEIGCGNHAAAVSIYKRAMRFGMPFCSHCFRLAITAALELNGAGPAFDLISNAHAQGQDVTSAVSVFIRHQIDNFRAGAGDIIQHIQNLISRFEALHITIDASALTHTALVCVKLGQHSKAVTLCQIAMARSGAPANPCFSRQCYRALLMAYSQTLDVRGMDSLMAALWDGQQCRFGLEKQTLVALRSTLKQVRSYGDGPLALSMQDILERAIAYAKRQRVQNTEERRVIRQETLRIMNDALADFQERGLMEEVRDEEVEEDEDEDEEEDDWDGYKGVAGTGEVEEDKDDDDDTVASVYRDQPP